MKKLSKGVPFESLPLLGILAQKRHNFKHFLPFNCDFHSLCCAGWLAGAFLKRYTF